MRGTEHRIVAQGCLGAARRWSRSSPAAPHHRPEGESNLQLFRGHHTSFDMDKPFFSVVIPTKNRSFLMGYAIESVLRQTCGDFELVVIDNDDSNDTERVVRNYADERVRYVRTGGLSMPDNWEVAFRSTKGRYITLLQDKMAMKSHALERVRNIVDGQDHPVVCWPLDTLYDLGYLPLADRIPVDGTVRALSSEQVLRIFLDRSMVQWAQMLPLGYTSCIRADLVEKIRAGPSGRLCPPASPDYTLAFQQLCFADHVMHLSEALSIMGGLRHSNGGSQMMKTEQSKPFVTESGGETALNDRVPVKTTFPSNAVCNDYVRMREFLGGRLEQFPLNLPNYFAQSYRDIVFSRDCFGVDTTKEMESWQKALSGQSPDVARQVRRSLVPVQREMVLRKFKLIQLWKVFRQFPKRLVFENVLEYVRYEDHPTPGAFVPEILHCLGFKPKRLSS